MRAMLLACCSHVCVFFNAALLATTMLALLFTAVVSPYEIAFLSDFYSATLTVINNVAKQVSAESLTTFPDTTLKCQHRD